jgi:hypothetical protein
MSRSCSLLIEPEHVELMEGDVGPQVGDAFRLVHEQRHRDGDAVWYFYAAPSLSKPEALRRAQQWNDSYGHPDWPGLG